jgi:hypothetical protein
MAGSKEQPILPVVHRRRGSAPEFQDGLTSQPAKWARDYAAKAGCLASRRTQ